MRITNEKINAYNATFEIGYSRHEYVGVGNATGTSYYLFILPKTTFTNVSLVCGFTNDKNSEESVTFKESVNFNNYSSENTLQSIYKEVDKIAVTDKSEMYLSMLGGVNTFYAIYFTDSRDNKYIIAKGSVRSEATYFFLSASCTTSNAIVADNWFLLKNGETQDLVCNAPLLIKPNYQQAIAVGSQYTVQKPGIVYYQDSSFNTKIMIVSKGDVLTTGGNLYYILEIA